MSYMLLILEDPVQRGTRGDAEGRAVYQQMMDFGKELRDKGLLVAGESLSSQKDGARITVRGGRAQVLDGPFAEAKEMVGGFFLLSCETRDEAMEIARQCPAAQWATVEVRSVGPCYEHEAAPANRLHQA